MQIIFPLEERILNRGCAEHKAAGLGCAADYRARFVDLYAPVSGMVFLFTEPQGGDWIRITDSDGRHWEMAHLSQRLVRTGNLVVAGKRIGVTGNTGAITTGPHLHLQIIKPDGSRLDPVPLLIKAPLPMAENFDNCIIRLEEGPQKGSFAYVKGGSGQKQIITRENAGLADLTFLQRYDVKRTIKSQIENVTQKEWDSFTTVPDKTWF